MSFAVRWIDRLVMRSQGILEFTQDPDCILRVQLTTAGHPVTMSGEQINQEDPVLAIHVWNEHLPKIPDGGATLEWAIGVKRLTIHSFEQVAKLIAMDSKYSRIRGICGTSALFLLSNPDGGTQLMKHLGFTVFPYQRPFGKFGEWWENLFSWWLLGTFNPASQKSRKFWQLQRTEIWMTRAEFIRRYYSINGS